MAKLHTSVNITAYMNLKYAFLHLGDSLAYQVHIANTDIYTCSLPPPPPPDH